MSQSCAVLGILPPCKAYVAIIKGTIQSIDGHSVSWREQVSIVEDEERQNALTLLVSVIYEDPTTPEALIAAVQKLLSSTTTTGLDEPFELCEQWASAPAPLPLQPEGVGYDELLHVSPEEWEGPRIATVMREYGILFQEKVLDGSEVDEIRQLVDTAITRVDGLLTKHRPTLTIGEDSFIFQEIASRNLERFDLRLGIDDNAEVFVEKYIQSQPSIQKLLHSVLGSSSEIDFDVSVVYSRPGAVTQKWHADGSHQKGANDAGWDDLGWENTLAPPYALCLFIPLIDLDNDTGYTQFWPGSHRSKDLIGFGPVAELTGSVFNGVGKAGDGVWYDYRLLHRGIFNVSKLVRPVIQVIFKKKWYVEKTNYGKESIIPDNA